MRDEGVRNHQKRVLLPSRDDQPTKFVPEKVLVRSPTTCNFFAVAPTNPKLWDWKDPELSDRDLVLEKELLGKLGFLFLVDYYDNHQEDLFAEFLTSIVLLDLSLLVLHYITHCQG